MEYYIYILKVAAAIMLNITDASPTTKTDSKSDLAAPLEISYSGFDPEFEQSYSPPLVKMME